MFIRVLAGFLAGLAAGILAMRFAYRKTDTHKPDETPSLTTSTSASN
jgi:hypothetical protein